MSMKDIIVSAPGKVILHGEHSVVYGKVAVASSLNLRCFLRASLADDSHVVVDLPDVKVKNEWSVTSLQDDLVPHLVLGHDAEGSPLPPTEECLRRLKQFAGIDNETAETRHLAVIAFLYLYSSICSKADKSRPLPAVHIRLISQLPVGAGLGSSAAFSVCLATTLLQLADRITPSVSGSSAEQHGDSNPGRGGGWSDADLVLINKWAFLGEKIIHGQPSGIDNSVSTYGGAIRFQNKQITPVCKMPRIKILLTNTKVPRSTKTLVAGVRKRHDKFPEVMGPVLDSMDRLAETSVRVYSQLCDAPASPQGYAQLEELIDINQQLLNSIGVGHSSLDTVIRLTTQHGLHSKLTGAGGGGCAYTLLTPDLTEEKIQAACGSLEEAGFDCWETSVGAPGVSCHPNHSDPSIPPSLLLSTQC